MTPPLCFITHTPPPPPPRSLSHQVREATGANSKQSPFIEDLLKAQEAAQAAGKGLWTKVRRAVLCCRSKHMRQASIARQADVVGGQRAMCLDVPALRVLLQRNGIARSSSKAAAEAPVFHSCTHLVHTLVAHSHTCTHLHTCTLSQTNAQTGPVCHPGCARWRAPARGLQRHGLPQLCGQGQAHRR